MTVEKADEEDDDDGSSDSGSDGGGLFGPASTPLEETEEDRNLLPPEPRSRQNSNTGITGPRGSNLDASSYLNPGVCLSVFLLLP